MNRQMTPQQPDDDFQRELAELLGAFDERESGEFTDAAAELAMQLPPIAPAPETRAALLARIAALPTTEAGPQPATDSAAGADALAEAPAPAATEPATEPATGAGIAHPTTAPAPERHRAPRRRRRVVFRSALLVGAVAAAVALFFGGFAVGGLRGGPNPQPTANADAVARIFANADALSASHPVTGGGTATLVWSDQAGQAAVILSGTGRAPQGKTYQLWYLRAGKAIPAGTLDGSNTASAAKELTGRLQTGDQVAITVEPSGGSAQPTSNPIVAIATNA